MQVIKTYDEFFNNNEAHRTKYTRYILLDLYTCFKYRHLFDNQNHVSGKSDETNFSFTNGKFLIPEGKKSE